MFNNFKVLSKCILNLFYMCNQSWLQLNIVKADDTTIFVSFAHKHKRRHFVGTTWCHLSPLALQINHTGEVVYEDTSVYGVVDKAVVLECGSALPDLYIWSFTKPGTDAIKAVLYNLGKGPRIQKLAMMVGPLKILPNTASIRIEKLPLAAHGLFTCQAFYDIEDEPIVYYYYVHLTVQGKIPSTRMTVFQKDASVSVILMSS